jgi:hypothetical protein
MGDNENYFEEIDDILSDNDEENTSSKEPKKGEGEESQESKLKSKEPVSSERYKNLEEHARQQSEEIKELKKVIEKREKVFEALTGDPEEDKKKLEEAKIRKDFEEDTPNAVKKTVDDILAKKLEQVDDRIDSVLEKIERKKIYELYDEIQDEYGINLREKEMQKKLSSYAQMFTPEERTKNPKKVLYNILKISGELDKVGKSNMPFVESGSVGGGGKRKKATAEETEEALVKKRINNSFNKGEGQKENIFQ